MKVGQKVIHAGLGLGEIQLKVRRTFRGQTCDFVRVRFDDGLTCLIRAQGQSSGFRSLVSPDKIPHVLEHIRDYRPSPPHDYGLRYRRNRTKFASGDIYELGEVIKGLTLLARSRPLPRTEAELLRKSRQRLADELSTAAQRSRRVVLREIERACRETG